MRSSYHDIIYDTAMTAAELKSDFKLTTDTPYPALTDELWSVYCGHLGENWPRYNVAALYFAAHLSCHMA